MQDKFGRWDKIYVTAVEPILVMVLFAFHMWLAFFFFRIDIAPVAILSILSCMVYIIGAFFKGENKTQNVMFMVFCEIGVFSLMSTIILSFRSGFFLYALPLPLSSFIELTDKKRRKFMCIAISIAMFLMIPLAFICAPLVVEYRVRMEPYDYMFLVGNFVIIVASYVTNVYVYMQRTEKQATETKYKSEHDTLTGLYNRSFLSQHVRAAVRRGRLKGSLIMFDIDNFKRINDEYGHDVGDIALKKVSEMAQSLIREDDILVRWGGEEFVIYIAGMTLDKAAAKAEEIRTLISITPYHEEKRLTISLGVTAFAPGENFETAMKRADQNLYIAKETGKNKVVKN